MACLDIGSDTVKCVVAEYWKKKFNILAVAETKAQGIKEGLVVEGKELINPIEEVIKKCEEIIGLNIKEVIVSVPSYNSVFNAVSASVKTEDDSNLITGKDIMHVIKKAVITKKIENYEYITMMPTSFTLDDNRIVKDPKGLTSNILSVRGVMISAPKDNIYKILAVLEHLKIDVLDIIIDIVGSYYANKNKEMDKNIGAIIDVGHEKTTIGIFNKGVLTNSKVINLGGKNIDNDLSFVYKITNKDAKNLKEKFASCDTNETQTTTFTTIENNMSESIKINQYEVSQVVNSRISEILKLCKKEINHLTKKEISYIIFTGGLTEIPDFNQLLKEIVKDGTISEINEIGVRHNKYSTCVGLIKFYAHNCDLKRKEFSIFSIDEQQELSGVNMDMQSDSMIGKLFGYIFNG